MLHLAAAAANIMDEMHKTGAHGLIAVSAAAAFIPEDPDKSWIVKQIQPRIFARTFADVRQMERVVKDSDLDWTLVSPTRLVSEPGKGEYRVRADFPPPGGGTITQADVAHFIGTALTSASYIRECPALAYRLAAPTGFRPGPQRRCRSEGRRGARHRHRSW